MPNSVPPDSSPNSNAAAQKSWIADNWPGLVYIAIALAVIVAIGFAVARKAQGTAKDVAQAAANYVKDSGNIAGQAAHGTVQGEAEGLLARTAAGDGSAADQVLAETGNWIGKTRRTPRTNQSIDAALNQSDTRIREAAVQAQLALDGVPQNEVGFAQMEEDVANPSQRAWALWMLGALGNRGIESVHATGTIESYLADQDVSIRAAAVDALSLMGTDETMAILLDRFRNDPSPVVQERAACDIAQSGIYTRPQRIAAAETLVRGVDDSSLSAQQHGWTLQALRDISGQNFGANSAAWQSWYDKAR